MERVGAEEYIIDKQNIPTKKQYDNLIKLALGKEKIGIEDVMEAEAQLAKDKIGRQIEMIQTDKVNI